MQFTSPRSVVEYWLSKKDASQNEIENWLDECADEFGFDALSIAEESVALGCEEFTSKLVGFLSPTQRAFLEFSRGKIRNDLADMKNKLEVANDLSRSKETRDLILEGRIRMELGLIEFQEGDIDCARDSLTWAETRLKSVSRYSLQHDISLLNKAAFHYAVGEDLMALNFYGEISLEKSNANETKAISRIGAGNILRNRGHTASAARHYWNAHSLFSKTPLIEMRLESGILFLELAMEYKDNNAESMELQIESAKPIASGEPVPQARINGSDIQNVINSCTELIDENTSHFSEDMIDKFTELRIQLEE